MIYYLFLVKPLSQYVPFSYSFIAADIKTSSMSLFQIVDKLDENINWAIPNWYFHFLFA